jgi:hypothetical protein
MIVRDDVTVRINNDTGSEPSRSAHRAGIARVVLVCAPIACNYDFNDCRRDAFHEALEIPAQILRSFQASVRDDS